MKLTLIYLFEGATHPILISEAPEDLHIIAAGTTRATPSTPELNDVAELMTPGLPPGAKEPLAQLDWSDEQIKCWDACSFSDEPCSERPITESTGGVVCCDNDNGLTELPRKVDVIRLQQKVIRLQHVQLKKADRFRRDVNALTKKADNINAKLDKLATYHEGILEVMHELCKINKRKRDGVLKERANKRCKIV